MLTSRCSLWGHALVLATLALAPGCAKHVPTAAQPCPCAAGATCCSSGICAQSSDLCDEATSALSAAAVGQWSGYLENYTALKSGADSLALAFTMNPDGTLAGTAKFGAAAPPAPATDPDVTWPPGLFAGLRSDQILTTDVAAGPVEGFTYTAQDIRWEARRLRFAIYLSEPWKPWCELQHSYLVNGGPRALPDGGATAGAGGAGDSGATGPAQPPIYSCVQSDSYSMNADTDQCFVGNDAVPVSCEKLALCWVHGRPCSCTAAGCTSGTTSSAGTSGALSDSFDISLRGDEGDGSLDSDGTTNNIRLTRASH
jgi:hypothetical protein